MHINFRFLIKTLPKQLSSLRNEKAILEDRVQVRLKIKSEERKLFQSEVCLTYRIWRPESANRIQYLQNWSVDQKSTSGRLKLLENGQPLFSQSRFALYI